MRDVDEDKEDGGDGDASGEEKIGNRSRKRKDKDPEEEEDTMELATTTTHNADGVGGDVANTMKYQYETPVPCILMCILVITFFSNHHYVRYVCWSIFLLEEVVGFDIVPSPICRNEYQRNETEQNNNVT